MANRWKLTCNCGGIYAKRKVEFKGLEVEAMVCPQCGEETFTLTQAKKVYSLMKFHNMLGKERKIVRIGNSLGITLPESLREFGIKVGRKVKVIAVAPNTLKVVLL